MLELFVDQALIDDWGDHLLPSRRPLFALPEAYFDKTKAMKRLAAYRQLHPRDYPSPGREMVASVIARYGTPPEAQH
jgi:hypothetical protein